MVNPLKPALRRMAGCVEKILASRGYRVQWSPQPYVEDPRLEIKMDFEFIIAHLLLFKKDIFFIEIGANDGKKNDPLYNFIVKYGWRGVMLEPVPETFRILEENYKGIGGVRLINAAVAERDGILPIYTVRMEEGVFEHAHQFSSFSKKALLSQSSYVPNITNLIEQKDVQCMSIDTLLGLLGDETVDILQIDTEGFDGTILRMIDFSRFRPTVINFEHLSMSKKERDAHAIRLGQAGYRMFSGDLDTCAYLVPETLSWRNT